MFADLSRLGRQSLVYGLGGVVSRILAVLLLPLYTRHLRPADYGAVETLTALTAVLATLLRAGLPSAFFRFYFQQPERRARVRLLRTSFWFTMGAATLGLAVGEFAAAPISRMLFATSGRTTLVEAAFVGMWAQLNYEQMTALFRVEQRPGGFVAASVANVFVTVGASAFLVVNLNKGPLGVIVGNFAGTLAVYLVLLAYRREQLGLEFDRPLLRAMNRFGLPLVPAALALWVINFADRFFLVKLSGAREVGLYSIGIRLSSAILLLVIAFSMAWPAFAYSIEEDDRARRVYAFVLTYILLFCCWLSLGLGLLAPWLVRLLTTRPFYGGSRVVWILGFALAAYAGYTVLAIGIGRTGQTKFNWVVTGSGALVNTVLNLALIPSFGMRGAAIATVVAYAGMFLTMAWYSQRIYHVPHQWRRIVVLVGSAVGLTLLGRLAHVGLVLVFVLTLGYPVVLWLLRFPLPVERRGLRQLVLRSRVA